MSAPGAAMLVFLLADKHIGVLLNVSFDVSFSIRYLSLGIYIYMAHCKANSPKDLENGEFFFEIPPQNCTKMSFFVIFFTYSY